MLFALYIKCIDKVRNFVTRQWHRFEDPTTRYSVYRIHVVVLPPSPNLVFKALITNRSGQHVASGIGQHAVDAGTSSNLLLKVLHILFYFRLSFCIIIYLWKCLVGLTWMPINANIDSSFHYPKRLPPQTGNLRSTASATGHSYQGESASLPFRMSFHIIVQSNQKIFYLPMEWLMVN